MECIIRTCVHSPFFYVNNLCVFFSFSFWYVYASIRRQKKSEHKKLISVATSNDKAIWLRCTYTWVFIVIGPFALYCFHYHFCIGCTYSFRLFFSFFRSALFVSLAFLLSLSLCNFFFFFTWFFCCIVVVSLGCQVHSHFYTWARTTVLCNLLTKCMYVQLHAKMTWLQQWQQPNEKEHIPLIVVSLFSYPIFA